MGLVVDKTSRLVTVDHKHNRYCVTTVNGNPSVIFQNGLKITSVFSRTKGRWDTSVGDNCPMLYALKRLNNLNTTPRDVAALCVSFRKILPVFLESGFTWDWIIPLPSSSDVCGRFAGKVHKQSSIGIIQPEALKKISAAQALADVRNLHISAKDKTKLKTSIFRFIKANGEEAPFQIKSVDTALRHHINPLIWGRCHSNTPPTKVLLVDDMVTSGTSLRCAAHVVEKRYPMAKIEALTIFGSSK
ncbi:TPA: phosphoribosyltransferase [Shewanella algae]|uniref:phosphoribosyltransferase n=1 Tax=Shewanella algae TaxID=38313 RepID=UPI001AB019DB|nr:phosphoribosyltransferase [Shewanella algae]MBO2580223.1 phosphoribosyltransferase [Shewanella algae]HDS1207810.1 phosphoribosyltransferase [Shewanella algae]